jgi:tetratricopeptide (TPR) repeat protein
MSETVVRASGLAAAALYATFLGWLYVAQPRTLAEVRGGLTDSVGAYGVDPAAFDEGLRLFREDRFVEARAAWARADSANRDARTQFYIAYSYYRQGWHRTYHDDELYRAGLETVRRAIALAPGGRLVIEDPELWMHSGDELQAELEGGMTRELSDFNPRRLFESRK